MTRPTLRFLPLIALSIAVLSACSSLSPTSTSTRPSPQAEYFTLSDPDSAREIVMISLGLVDTGYRFGGRNPEAGLDCSGMVSYVVEQASGRRLPHNAAEIAARTRPVSRNELHPGDLVFFNTSNRPYSHMGIYLGDDRFIHAPSSQGRVRLESLSSAYFAQRYDGARTLFQSS
jgi:cell wall-associated NlpC family hydrolase